MPSSPSTCSTTSAKASWFSAVGRTPHRQFSAGADAGELHTRQREDRPAGVEGVLGHDTLAAVARLDHEDDLVHLARGDSSRRQGMGGLDLAHEAQVAEAHDLVRPRSGPGGAGEGSAR